MNKKELIEKILNDNDNTRRSTEELQILLDKELSKSVDKIDSGVVNELSLAIIESKGQKPLTADVSQKYEEFEKMRNAEKRKYHLPKWSTAIAAACVILILGNFYSVSAWGMNIFSFFVELTNGGVSVDFSGRKDEIRLPVTADDPYGIAAVCRESGIIMETPHYIPDGFFLTYMEHDSNADERYATFTYKNGDKKLHFMFKNYDNNVFGIPSNEHNLSEIEICGHKAIMSREDNQMIVAFNSGDYVCTIMTNDIDYDECDKIIKEMR